MPTTAALSFKPVEHPCESRVAMFFNWYSLGVFTGLIVSQFVLVWTSPVKALCVGSMI